MLNSHLIPLNNYPLRLLCLFLGLRENEGSERVINLPQVTQPESGSRSKIQRHPCCPQLISQKCPHVSRQEMPVEQDVVSSTCLLVRQGSGWVSGSPCGTGMGDCHDSQLSTTERDEGRLCFDKGLCPCHLECWKLGLIPGPCGKGGGSQPRVLCTVLVMSRGLDLGLLRTTPSPLPT